MNTCTNLVLKFLVTFSIFFKIIDGSNDITIDLIHRDSPISPLYNPHLTQLERYQNSIKRGLSRQNRFHNLADKPNPYLDVSAENGQYVMKLSVGTPPVDFYGLVDTGSDLIWTQCLPCDTCYKQVKPYFDPTASSSYTNIRCETNQCGILMDTGCSDPKRKFCNFTYGYGDDSLIRGFLAQESVTLQQNILVKNVVFGCGHNNTGTFSETEMGIIGLGRGPVSLPSQIGSRIGNNKFSFCLVPFHTDPKITSKLNFGREVSGEGVVSTPLVEGEYQTFYYVTLEGITVGKKGNFIPYSDSITKGNVFMDTGTPPTLLPKVFYNKLANAIKNEVNLTPYVDKDLGTQLCYKGEKNVVYGKIPVLTARFGGGVEVPWVGSNIFISPKDGVFCFAMAPTDDNVGTIGNFAQSNILIGYDPDKMVVSFKPTDCTKY